MTVPLDQIIDLCAFHGDLDKIAGYLCQKDVDKERQEIHEDPPELPPRPMQGSCSPVKDGENAEEKLIKETIKIISGSSPSTSNGKNKSRHGSKVPRKSKLAI